MGPRERREREREEVRTRILDAARELFASEGVDSVTMRRIADRIEYSPTAIYFHFRDKESLLAELCDYDFRNFAHGFNAIAQIPDAVERLRHVAAHRAQRPCDFLARGGEEPGAIVVERRVARERLVHYGGEAVLVAAGVRRAAAGH